MIPDAPKRATSVRLNLARLASTNARTIAAMVLRLWGAFASFVLTVLVARVAGASVTGHYALAVSTVTLGALFAVAGLDQIMVRAIGGDLREGRTAEARAALRATLRRVLTIGAVVAVITALLAPWVAWVGGLPSVIALATIAIVLSALLRILNGGLRAAGAVMMSQALDGPVHSTLLLAGVLAMVVAQKPIDALVLVAGYDLCLAAACLLAWVTLRNQIRGWSREAFRAPGRWTDGWTLLVAGGGQVLVAWLLMVLVGALLGPDGVGAFRVAVQVITMISLFLTTIEGLVSPQFAGDFRVGDTRAAWRRHREATLLMAASAVVPIVLCLFWPRFILGLFGPEFLAAAVSLQIMAVGQLINIATGPIGGLMVMSGRERYSLIFSLCGIAIAVALSLLLMPLYGMVGAAVATAAATTFRNVAAFVVMWRARGAERRVWSNRDPTEPLAGAATGTDGGAA